VASKVKAAGKRALALAAVAVVAASFASTAFAGNGKGSTKLNAGTFPGYGFWDGP
jgi:hypothetical protein